MGGGGCALKPPPGRVARSAATIDLWPVSASMRISGKALLHRHVLDPGLLEARTARRVAVPGVEALRVHLGMERDAARAGAARLGIREVEQGVPDAATARLLDDRHPAELAGAPAEQQPARPDDAVAVVHGDEVERLSVAAVELVLQRNPLLDAEHEPAHLDGRLALRRVARPADPGAHVFSA